MGPQLGFKCNYSDCLFICIKSNKISEHSKVHKIGKTFECDVCHNRYGSQRLLTKHMHIVHNSRNHPILKCNFEGCLYTTYVGRYLKSHLVVHQSDRPYVCSYSGCDMSFKYSASLTSHINCVHLNLRPYHCKHPTCDKTFKFMTGWRRHMATHTGRTPAIRVECDLCGKTYSKTSLIRHKILVHNIKNKPLIDCPHCPYKTVYPNYMRQHQQSHQNRRSFRCRAKGCDKRFKTEKSLRLHKIMHSNVRLYSCDWPGCELTFKRRYTQIRHLRTHTMDGKTEGSLRVYKMTHSDVRPHSCDWPECGFTFKLKSHLKRHMRIHINDGIRFWCDYCHHSFKYKTDLNRHVKREHLNQ